jgi:hypothetical protein
VFCTTQAYRLSGLYGTSRGDGLGKVIRIFKWKCCAFHKAGPPGCRQTTALYDIASLLEYYCAMRQCAGNPAVSSTDCWRPRNTCNRSQIVDEFPVEERWDVPRKDVGMPGIGEAPTLPCQMLNDNLATHGITWTADVARCRSVKAIIARDKSRRWMIGDYRETLSKSCTHLGFLMFFNERLTNHGQEFIILNRLL